MELREGRDLLQLRQATEEDFNSVLHLLVNAAEWLQTKGTKQWDYYINDLEGNTAEVQESISKNNTYILEHDGKAIATITLENSPNEWDTDIWGQDVNQGGLCTCIELSFIGITLGVELEGTLLVGQRIL